MPNFAELRNWMVETQLKRRGIKDERLLKVFLKVPREEFVWAVDQSAVYGDHPLRIEHGQTISQPYMVAIMTELLELSGSEKVLEIGTGSGYQTAILCELAKHVYSVERIPELARQADERLKRLGYSNCSVLIGDGTLGWCDEAPFDAIIVTAGAPSIPQALLDQLAEGGRMCIPVGDRNIQDLIVARRTGGKIQKTNELACAFVPLLGKQGW